MHDGVLNAGLAAEFSNLPALGLSWALLRLGDLRLADTIALASRKR